MDIILVVDMFCAKILIELMIEDLNKKDTQRNVIKKQTNKKRKPAE